MQWPKAKAKTKQNKKQTKIKQNKNKKTINDRYNITMNIKD